MKLLSRPSYLRRVARAVGSRLFHWAENNGQADIARNGETWLLEALVAQWGAAGGRRVVIDAGANLGDFTAALQTVAKHGGVEVEVHAIDPAGACIGSLERRFRGTQTVRLVQAALGEQTGTMRLHSPAPGSPHASLVTRPDSTDAAGETVPVIRLADYLREQGLARVDLLKLDVEGFELAALRGLAERLNPRSVEVVQFEYGGTTFDAGASLRVLFALFESRGYAVAKLLPRALIVREYRPWMDHFTYANYVAVPRDWCHRGGA